MRKIAHFMISQLYIMFYPRPIVIATIDAGIGYSSVAIVTIHLK